MTQFEFHWIREYSTIYGAVALFGFQKVLKEDLNVEVDALGQGQNGWFSSFFPQGYKEKIQTFYAEKMKNDIPFVEKRMQQLEDSGKKFIEFTKNLKFDPNTFNEELISQLNEYFEIFTDYAGHLWRGFYFPLTSAKLFEEKIVSKDKSKMNEILSAYSIPSKKAGIFLIGEKFKDLKTMNEKVDFLLKEYPWITFGDYYLERMNRQEAEEFAKSVAIPEDNSNQEPLELNQEEKDIVEMYQYMLYIRDRRDEFRREAFYNGIDFFKEIQKRINLPLADIALLMPNEIAEALNGVNQKPLIEKRKKGFIVKVIDGKISFRQGPEVIKDFIVQETSSEIKGIVGCAGKVTGKVQIINNSKDISKFEKGNVMVALSTNPEYVPAMDKAVAFVTDDGGITSHAAIVAREQNKPCIVGTGNATKALKDGDEVEVDADKGIVRKL